MKRIIISLAVLFFACGCMPVDVYSRRQLTFSNYSQTTYPAKQKDYPVELYFDDLPQKDYEIIGEISGKISDDIRPVLVARARQLGADGLTGIKITQEFKDKPANLSVSPGILPGQETPVYTPGFRVKIYNIKAKVFRYK